MGVSRIVRAWRADTWVKPFFARYWRVLALALGLGLVAAAFAGGLMFTSGYMISLAATMPFTVLAVHLPSLYVRIFGVGKPLLSYLERLTSHDWALRMTSELRRRLYRTLDEQPASSRAVRKLGEVLGLLAEDIEHIQNLYLRTIYPLVIAWLLYVIVVLALGVFDVAVAASMALLLGVVVFVLPVVSVCVNGARLERSKALKARLYAELTDNVLGVADWMYSGRTEDCQLKQRQLQAQIDEIDFSIARFSRLRDLLSQLVFAGAALVLLLWAASVFGVHAATGASQGGVSAAASALAFATPENAVAHAGNWIAAFVLCLFPLIESFSPASEAAMGAITYGESIERLNRLSGAESAPADASACGSTGAPTAPSADPAKQDGEGERPVDGSLTFSNVSFAYPSSKREVLSELSLQIPAGQRLAVLGRSGAGKSTLVALLRGDFEPKSGEVSVGGVKPFALGDDLARYVGVIQQTPHLFNWTLRENLALAKPSASDEELVEALTRVGLSDLLARLPRGLDTMVDERGKRFSGGERHRIALARVLLSEVGVVVLDEPFAGLDPVTEQDLLDALFEVLEGRTVVLVTHHLQGVSACDRVVFIEEGRVAIDGSPEQLERENAYYRGLLAADRGIIR